MNEDAIYLEMYTSQFRQHDNSFKISSRKVEAGLMTLKDSEIVSNIPTFGL